jgi:hypothetical protein
MSPGFPALFQFNTRVGLTELSRRTGRSATLDDVPDSDLDQWQDLGFDWIWLLSVWRTGPRSRCVSLSDPKWMKEFQETLPDLTEGDIGGSGFAVADYSVSPSLGGPDALGRFRDRLKNRGLKLMLDFVPNHMGLDHPWAVEHPERFVSGTTEDLQRQPQNYTRVPGSGTILAHGRDPYFPGWPDTLQLDYSHSGTQDALVRELVRIAGQCDGVRCDMAMLLLPDVFERTWGRRPAPFWPRAISAVRAGVPGFCFMAEVYWDLEWPLQQQGFDYTYDKRLYDRLREGHAGPVRDHLRGDPAYQDKLARFLENHDEPRAAAVFDGQRHEVAAVVTYMSPGLRFFHQGQLEGRRVRISPHLVRAPDEPVNGALQDFYGRLLAALRRPAVRDGRWRLLECRPAWDGNGSWDGFLAFLWEGKGETLLVAVNQSPKSAQCYVPLRLPAIAEKMVLLRDMLSSAQYTRRGDDLISPGLYLDLPPWGRHVFDIT